MIEEKQPKVISLNEIYKINKGDYGYIDEDANFYPICKEEEYNLSNNNIVNKKWNANEIVEAIFLSTNPSQDDIEHLKKLEETKPHIINGFTYRSNAIHLLLREKGYQLFLKGYSDQWIMEDFSDYNIDESNKEQLLILNHLLTLNTTPYNKEEQKELIRTLSRKIFSK